MNRAIRIEFRKMRRLRTVPILLVMLLAVVALSSITLFSASGREAAANPEAMPWGRLLLNLTMMSAMVSPLLTAVLASRQVDIEHTGGGWILSASAGYSPGTLLRAKLVALASLLVPAVALQTVLVVGLGLITGITAPFDAAPWIGYTALLALVDLAFLSLHLWLAAVVENQLVGIGVGLIGAFVGVFTLLLPPVAARLIPWGYYAVISYAGMSSDRIDVVSPAYGWVIGFLILVGALFMIVTRHLDRIER